MVFSINHIHPANNPSRKFAYVPLQANERTTPIVQAVYHHPLLITLSRAFILSIYDLSNDTVVHTQTLRSFTTYPPTSMVLSSPTSCTYKLLLAYSIPIFPAHFSVGVTELIISGEGTSEAPPLSPSSLSQMVSSPRVDPLCVTATRTARTLDIPQGWIDQKKLRLMEEQWSRKVSGVAATQTDGKWVVLAPGEGIVTQRTPMPDASQRPPSSPGESSFSSLNSPTSLQLYRLSLPPTSSITSPPPKLTFVRNLHGQTGTIGALALADGRCVSLGLNGSIWVWDLEAGTGVEVAEPELGLEPTASQGTVVFDDRRVITTCRGAVVVRNFDN